MTTVHDGGLATFRSPHSSPAECDRWIYGVGSGTPSRSSRGCPHFTDAEVEALKASGQWPTTAKPVWRSSPEEA